MFFRSALPTSIFLHSLLRATTLGAATTSSGGSTPTPAPISVPPSENFDGNDGPWSSFFLRVGTPPQTVSVLISTTGNQPWVVLPEACSSTSPSDCAVSRGSIFSTNESSTWVQNNVTAEGIFALGIEANLGLSGNGLYGYDTIALGYQGSVLPSLAHQVVSGIVTDDFYMGLFGLNPAATNFSNLNNPIQSYMSALKSQSMIPSLSYGYTAGNQYRLNKVLASLTLGGYDASLYEPNDLTVAMNFAAESALVVNINSIVMNETTENSTLSSTPFPAFIDSTVPYLYLPTDVCKKFEEKFGIVYDNATGLYLVGDALHTQMLNKAANVTFSLTNVTGGATVDIVLPYQAFDLMADYPLVPNATRYFPLQRANSTTQYTLGRTFLQEAYLIADYERSNFSIYQRSWNANAEADIRAISPIGGTYESQPTGNAQPTGSTLPSGSSQPAAQTQAQNKNRLPMAAVVSGAVGGGVLMIVITGCVILIRQRHRKLKALEGQQALPLERVPSKASVKIMPPTATYMFDELDAIDTRVMGPELDGHVINKASMIASGHIHEMPANEFVGYELFSPTAPTSPPQDMVRRLALRERELEEQRAALRERQYSRRRRFQQDNPDFVFDASSHIILGMPQQMENPQGPPVRPARAGTPPQHELDYIVSP